jgi:dual oxidase
LIKYITQLQFRAAFGWGVVLAKASAGAIYPTFFFVILSMSRYFSTFLRRWYHISRFINWDLSQRFHIAISCLAIVLATLHAIGHLSGTFVYGSRANREPAVNNVVNGALGPQPQYIDYIRSLPGITGLVALGLLYTLAILSMPQVRKWNYEVFQLGHLLMYPIIGLLCAHGSAALLQQPMLGYFMAFPALLVVIERIVRVLVGFRPLPATIRILDSETVEIKVDIPGKIIWKYRPGQWVFLQVPKLSLFQWHPFTISVCLERQVQLHIKTDGNWTKRLRDLVPKGQSEGAINIGLNGPFGAPAERFYDFSHTLLVRNIFLINATY